MLHEKITLPRTGVILETYLADEKSLKQSIKRPFPHRPLVLVFPGGGYHFLSDREAEPVALRLLSLGIQAVVVRYSVAPARYPVALEQAAEAMQYAREHAEQWLCDSRKIAVMGFSAGGHLASTFATHYPAELRPAFQILVYPVISMDETITHSGSRENLIGKNPSKALIDYYSNEKHVNAESPRAFIALSDDDRAVPVENSLRYYKALHRYQIPVSLHIYPTGGHGWGYNESFRFKKAVHDELADWLRSF